MTPELHLQNEFRDWFALPFVVSPESHPTFSAYFGRQVSLLYLYLTLPICSPGFFSSKHIFSARRPNGYANTCDYAFVSEFF